MAIILPENSSLYHTLNAATERKRIILFAGLPGVGKSLFLQQCGLLAKQHGRKVHQLQWDVTRAAFETPELLARYPEIAGVTHSAIRKGVGLWARQGIVNWHTSHGPEAVLIGEVPLIGERLTELTYVMADDAETLLASEDTLFIIPVPSKAVRAHIEQARQASMAKPQHAREAADAPPDVLRALWLELYHQATAQGLTEKDTDSYDPTIYAAVYQNILAKRHGLTLAVDAVLEPQGSVYDHNIAISELQASPEEVTQIMTLVEASQTAS